MPKFSLNWPLLTQVMLLWDWNWRRLAQETGFSESHLCEIRKGKKNVTLPLLVCISEATGLSIEKLLILPPSPKRENARARLKITHMEDGRPWPVQQASPKPDDFRNDPQFNYVDYLEKQREAGANVSPQAIAAARKERQQKYRAFLRRQQMRADLHTFI